VCPYNIYKGGGVQECVRALHSELSKRGHTVRIITPMPQEVADTPIDGVIFIGAAKDFKSPFGTTAQLSASITDEAVDELLEREKFDLLHFHEPWVPILSRQILMRSDVRHIATFHARLPETMMTRTIERVVTPYTKSILKYLDARTAVSEAAATYVRTLTDDPITIIPNGIDLGKYKVQSKEHKVKSTRDILYIGRLEKRKGVKYLLRAFEAFAINHPDARLTIAGDGPDRAKLELFARDLSVKNVKFIGYVSEQKKSQLFQTADLMCSPALFGESFGIVLLEAMAAGVPVVAGDNPGYASVMTGRGRLSLVNPKDTDEFARRLELLLYDSELRQLWQTWAAGHIKQFAYPRVVDKYEALYKKI